jgi:hypothetical protein
MKYFSIFIFLMVLLSSCNNELTFEEQSFEKKSSLPCKGNCPHIAVKIPVAKNVPIVADSINKKVFAVMKEIIYVGENPFSSTNYNGLLTAFINSYEETKKENPDESFGWEGKIEGKVKYQSDKIVDIEINHYTFTGGAHGYQGMRSLIFDIKTGKHIANEALFKDNKAFTTFAEKKFRKKFNIPEKVALNNSGFMFEEEKFQLPQTFFFTDEGLLLYYNVYEIASYADGPKELLLPYEEVAPYLAIK